MNHSFSKVILNVIASNFPKLSGEIYKNSELLNYLNIKTKSANRGSKSRGSFANLYAIYVLVEDYIRNGYDKNDGYKEYSGAKFSDLFNRQRELPFGAKLQNHALNHRMNEEFRKYYPTCEYIPIIRDTTNRYWFNENLLKIKINGKAYNIAKSIIEIIDAYIEAKRDSFDKFINTCEKLKEIEDDSDKQSSDFVLGLLEPNVDARIFEIVSFAILKYNYSDEKVFFGFDPTELVEESLKLYKTGRTNANDGGIDFVMKPLGRFYQVTETTDVKKYFLDIDKLEKFPITFVVKSEDNSDILIEKIKRNAEAQYPVRTIVDKYISCIEEIINIPELKNRFANALEKGMLTDILSEIILQSKVEFNYEEKD